MDRGRSKWNADLADKPDIQKAIFSASTIVLKTCLTDALMELAAYHGNKPGKWLDDLEHKFIQDAKCLVSEGISLESEHRMVNGVINFIRLAIDDVREGLAGPEDND